MPRDSHSIHGKLMAGPGVSVELARNLMEVPAAWIIAEGRRGRLERIEWQGTSYARKIYRVTSPAPLHPFLRLVPGLVRWSRARRSWQSMHRGLHKQLPLPEPIALQEKRDGAILISSWIRGEPLHHWHARALQEGLKAVDEFRFARWIGAELGRVLIGGLSTRDLAPQNVLIDGPPEGPWKFSIVDLDDSRVGSAPARQRVVHSLAQVGHLPPTITRTLKWRAIESFLMDGGLELVGDRRRAIEEISASITRLDHLKAQRQIRKGRPGPMAGWGIDEHGLPVPFAGARKGPGTDLIDAAPEPDQRAEDETADRESRRTT